MSTMRQAICLLLVFVACALAITPKWNEPQLSEQAQPFPVETTSNDTNSIIPKVIWDFVWHETFKFLLDDNFTSFNPPSPTPHPIICNNNDTYWRRPDGSCNNLQYPHWGMSGSMLRRLGAISYPDGTGNKMKPINARRISNLIYGGWDAQETVSQAKMPLSMLQFAMGQFFLHDLILINTNASDYFPIPVPGSNFSIPFWRSAVFPGTGTGPHNPRQFANAVPQWIDLNTVYGNSAQVASLLRANDGTGRLRTGADGFSLPLASAADLKVQPMQTAFDKGTPSAQGVFLAGDIRANQNFNLLAFHTLFLREHNRRAMQLKQQNPHWSDEQLYQQARKLNIATWQSILIHEFTSSLGGVNSDSSWYMNYITDFIESHQVNNLNPMVHVAWDILYRLHSTISDVKLCQDVWCHHWVGNVTLQQQFFNTTAAFASLNLNAYLRGLANTAALAIGPHMADAMRNVQAPIGPQGQYVTVFDLAATDLQRMVDLGVGSINDVRSIFHLPPLTQWSDLTSDTYTLNKIQNVYSSVQDVDGLTGSMAEEPLSIPLVNINAVFGSSIFRAIGYQALVYSMSDRLFYLRPGVLTSEELSEINSVHLSDVIIRNTNISCFPLYSTFYQQSGPTTGPGC